MDIIRTASPADVLALVPYRLGFQPAESLVMLSVRADTRLGVLARVDLAAVTSNPAVASDLAAHMSADGAHRVALAAYTPDAQRARTVLADVAARLSPALGVATSWWVSPTGYADPDCDDPTCCPRPLADLSGTQVAAHMTYAGHTIAQSRETLMPQVQVSPTEQATAVAAAEAWNAAYLRDRDTATAVALAVWRLAVSGGEPTGATYGTISAALALPSVRDVLMLDLVPAPTGGHPSQEDAAAAVLTPGGTAPDERVHTAADLLHAAAAHTPEMAGAVLAVAGWLAWWTGHGARANLVIDAAREADPHNTLAGLLEQILTAGIAPGWVR